MADYSQDIIGFVQSEKQKYEDSSSEIRELIKKCRKNYACKFLDPYTTNGRQKMFVPMTRWEVDAVVPKVFVNDKAVTVLPENEKSLRSAFIAERVLKSQINNTSFPTKFRNSMYDLGIDGTTVWATYWNFEREILDDAPTGIVNKVKSFLGYGKTPKVNVLKDTIGYQQVDILNVWIDPTADSIEDAPSIIVKNIFSLDKVRRNKLYKNTLDITGFTIQPTSDKDASSTNVWDVGKQDIQSEVKMTAIYERWGRFPLCWITGKKKDEKSGAMIEGVVTIADLDASPVILRVDKNPFAHQKKPFVECWYQKKKGRWYGIGIAEKLIDLQTYSNKTINRRIENEDVLHSGLFKKKRGSGISIKSIRSVPGGVIEVDNMDDLQQLEIKDISQLSKGTLLLINDMAARLTGANEIATGNSADRSATTSIIKDRNADTRFAAVRGYVNDFLIRFFKQWVALDRQFIDRKFVLRVTGEDVDFNEIDDVLGIPAEARNATPNYRFLEVDPDSIRGDYDLEVDIDQSVPQNKAEMAERILKLATFIKQFGVNRSVEPFVDTYADSLGLVSPKYKEPISQNPQIPGQPGQPLGGAPAGVPSELQQFMEANGTQAPGQGQPQEGLGNTQQIPRNAVAIGQ